MSKTLSTLLAGLAGLAALAMVITSCSEDAEDADGEPAKDTRAVLVAAGFECSEVSAYEQAEDEADFGVQIRSEFSCTKDEASITAMEFDSPQAAEFAVGYISTMACSVLGQPVSLVVSDQWILSEGEEAGTGALISEAANALDEDITMEECEIPSSTDDTPATDVPEAETTNPEADD